MHILLNGLMAQAGRERLQQRFADRVSIDGLSGDEDEDTRAARLGHADVIVTMAFDGSFPAAPKLKLVQLPISGLDQIDLAAVPAQAAVCNVYEHEIGIAEYVFAGLLRHMIDLDGISGRFRQGDWSDSPRFAGNTRGELAGQSLLCVGYGNIGQAIARRAAAFDMEVLAVTRSPRQLEPMPRRLGSYDALPDLLPEADVVVICCPLTDQTRGLLDVDGLGAMKDTAILVNVARGPIVDEDALFQALQARRIGDAILDTWYQYADPRHPDLWPSRHPFQELDNVVMTPHLCGWTEGLLDRRWARIGDNLAALMDGGSLINVVRDAAG